MEKKKLPTEFKEPWTAALRSGEYEQCTGQLKKSYGYCCLGVFAEVHKIPHDDFHCLGPSGEELGYVPLDRIIGDMGVRTLMRMNDSGKSFPEIADWIEENL